MTALNPYINFDGNTREAMEFYKSVFGGELTVSTFGDYPMPGVGEDEQDKVMHSQLVIPGGMILMAADLPAHLTLPEGSNITVSLSGSDHAELSRFWNGLADGADIGMELTPAPWGDTFGQLTDKYGVAWLVNIAGQPSEQS